ncbi:MAG: hypothetical protein ACOYU4_04500 [Thermodesulfobacteriota bacterium]
MKLQKMLFVISAALLFILSAIVVAAAGDFDWMRDLNTRAEADLSGFRARLAARFNIGDAQVKVVLSNVERPADAYMVLRFGEMSARPADYVIERYRAGESKGWGVLAKSLGIKPGSKEFHALKRGHDIDDYSGKGKNKGKDKGKCKNKSKGKGRD